MAPKKPTARRGGAAAAAPTRGRGTPPAAAKVAEPAPVEDEPEEEVAPEEEVEEEAPEGQEEEMDDAPEDEAVDDAPEGEGDWAEQVDAEMATEEDGQEEFEEEEQVEEEGNEEAGNEEDGNEEEHEEAEDGKEGETKENGDGEEYEVVDELGDDLADALEEIEAEEAEKKEKKEGAEEGKDAEKKEDKDKVKKVIATRRPFFIPTVAEYKMEMRKMLDACTVVMGPITYSDLSEDKISQFIVKAQKVSNKLGKQEATDEFSGFLELVFFSEADATACAETLKEYREKFLIEHLNKDDRSKEIGVIREYGDIHAGKTGETTLVVSEIEPEVKEEEIAAQIPEAKHIIIPMHLQASRKKRYAYIELDEAGVKAVEGREVKIREETYKVYHLENMGSFFSVMKQLRTLRFPELTARLPLESSMRTHLFKLNTAVTHYMRVDYIDSKQKETLKRAAEPLRTLLHTDSVKPRRDGTTGARGFRSRGRGGPARGRGGYQGDRFTPRGGPRPGGYQKRSYDDYDSSRDVKRPRGEGYGGYGGGYDDRRRGGAGDDMDTRQAMELLVGLTSMLKGQGGSPRDAAPARRPAVASVPASYSSRDSGSSYRGSSSSYRGGSSNYRGSSYRASSGGSSYRGRGGRGSGGSYSSRY